MGRDGWVTLGIVELEREGKISIGGSTTYFESVLAFALFIEEVT